MKKLNFFANLLRSEFAMSGMKAGNVTPDDQPTVNRRSRLMSVQWHYSANTARAAQKWLKYAAMFVMLLTIGVGNVWGTDITLEITVSSFGSGTTSSYADMDWEEDASDGSTISGTGKIIMDASAIRFKSSYIYNTVAMPGAIKSIEVTKASGTSRSITPYIHTSSLASGTSGATALSASTHPNTWNMTAAQITADNRYFRLNMTTNSAYYVGKIVITCEGGGGSTPSLSATPTSLAWGSVLQGSSQSTKSFTISGSNLTGNLTVATTGGYSASCGSSITVTSGSPATTSITVTPPSTSTAGTKNGTITFSGGGLASSVTVNLSMTVVASHTVTFKNNGVTLASGGTRIVADGGTVGDLPILTSGDACDPTSTTFIGWTESVVGTKQAARPTLITSSTTISADKVYNAVWAKGTRSNSTTTFERITGQSDITDGLYVVIIHGDNNALNTSLGRTALSSGTTLSSPAAGVKWTAVISGNKVKFKNSSNQYLGTSATTNGTAVSANGTYQEWTISTDKGGYSGAFNLSNGNDLEYYSGTFKVYAWSNSYKASYPFYIYVPQIAYADYLTSCCTNLASINGFIKSISGTSATLKWDVLSNVDGTTPYSVTVSPSTGTSVGGISTVDGYKNCTVSGLTAGTAYTFTINAFGDASHCNSSQEITATTPKITLGSASGTSVYIENNGPGSKQTFTVTAVGLTGNLTVTAPTNFEVCDTENGTYASSKTLTPTSGAVSTTVYFRLVTGKSADSYSGSVTVSGGSATSQTVTVNGTVSPACHNPSITAQSTASASYNLNVTATALSVTASKGDPGDPTLTYQWYSNTANSKTTPTPTPIDGATSSSYTPPTTAAGTTKYYFCEVSSGACAETTNISAITVNTPTITVSETARAFGDRKVSGGPYEMTFTVSGSNLAKDQGIGLAITGTNAGMFAIKNNVTSITQTTAGAVAETTVTVQYSPTGAGSHSATLTLSSTSATSKTVALTGTGKWEVTWNVNGGATTSLVANGTKPTLPSPAPSSCDLTSTTFIGWATSSWSGKLDDVSDKTIHADNSTMSNITANGTTFYAVFAKAGGAPITWDKVASMNSLSVGDVFVFASGTNAVTDPENTTDPPKGTSITVNGSNQITSTVTDAMKWTFAKDGDNYTFYPNGDDEKWLRCNTTASSSSNNNMRVDAISGRTKFAIDNSGYLVTNDTYTDRYFSYYSDGNDFRGYTGTSNGAFVPICYKRNGGTTYSEYLTSCCDLKAVTGLTVSGVTGNSVTLTWTAPSPTTGIDHLELRNASTDAKIGNDIAVGTTSAMVSGLTECTTYTYKVVSVGATCETPSETVEGTPYSGAKTITYKFHDDVTADGSFTTDCTHSSTTLPNPSRTGYTLNGWYDAATSGSLVGAGGASYTPSANITLHAQWSQTNYTVTMAQSPSAGATLTGGTTTAHYGNTINITTTVPSGYRFTGWTASPSVTFANASSTSTSFSMPASNVTITANFVQIHAVSFSVPTGGGTVVSPPSTVDHGGTLTFPNVTGVDCGTFLGWTTATNSSYSSTSSTPTPLYTVGANTTINAAAVFYAVYSKVGDNPVSATLYAHDGNVNSITNAGYTNTTITATGIGTTNTTNYKTKFDDVGDKVIFELDGTPTSFTAAFQTPSSGTSGTSTIKLYEASSTSGPWTEITSTSITSSSTSATLSETTASNFTQRVLKLEMTSKGYNMMCGDITIVGLRAPITYTTNPTCVDWRLQSIAVTTAPTKTTYNECDEFDPAGMVVTATMYEYGNESNTTTKDVSGYTCSPTSLTSPGNPVVVTISYTEKGVTKTTTQNVTVTDLTNYTVTFHDGNRTPIIWTQTSHCDAVDLDDYTGALACGDYTFVGWSTSSTSYDDQSATITTWVSGSYVPTANTNLYAVYRKGAEPADFSANCSGGTFTIGTKNGGSTIISHAANVGSFNSYEYGVANSDYTEDQLGKFLFERVADNTYKISLEREDDYGDGIKRFYIAPDDYSAGSIEFLETYDADQCKWKVVSGTYGTWRIYSEFRNTYVTKDYGLAGRGNDGATPRFRLVPTNNINGSDNYDLELTPVALNVYHSNPSCGGTYTITFDTHGGTFVQGNYDYATETTSGLSGTTSSKFPSASMPGCEFYGWKEGSKQDEVNIDAPVGLFEADDDLSVSSNKTYHAVYYYMDDDWVFDPTEGGTYHLYYEVNSTKYFVSSTPTNSWAYLSTSTSCTDAKNVVITPGTGNNAGKYSIAVDGYTIIPENGGTKFKRGEFWWTITERNDGTFAINGMNNNRNIVGNSNGSSLEHTGYNAGSSYSGWYYPSFGRCRQHHWTSDPEIGPTITLGSTGVLNVTSTNGKTIKATNKLTVKATRYGTQTKLYLLSNVAGVGFLAADGSALSSDATGTYIQTNASGELTTTNIIVTYSPTVTTDGIETATITVRDNTSPSVLASATRTIKVRHLPAKFVIATKVGDDWYALPNNNSTYGNPAGVKLSSVNESTGVATYYSDQYDGEAVGSKNYLTWTLNSPVNTNNANYGYPQHGDRVRFYDSKNSKYLEVKESDDDIKNSVASPGTSDHPLCELLPATTDLVDYTLKNEGQNRYIGVDGSKQWGDYTSATTVRLLVPNQQPAPTITWRNNMLGEDHTTNKAENGVVTLPTGDDPASCNATLYPTFCGWSATEPGGDYWGTAPTYITNGTAATTNTTYYAVFKDATRNRWYTQCPTYYTLTFNRGTGTGDDYVQYTENTTYTMPNAATTSMSKDGYTLAGWTTTTSVTVSGSPVAAGGTIPVGATVSGISSDLTFTAVWTGTLSITATNGVWLTSYSGVTVYTTSETSDLITVSTPAVVGATGIRLTYLDGNGDAVAAGSSRFRLCYSSTYNVEDGATQANRLGELTLSAGVYSATYSISYTPAAGSYNTTDTYTLKLELMQNSTVLSEATLTLHGRALPQKFVIAANIGGQWRALPADLATASGTTVQDAYLISVDNTTTPTTAIAPKKAIYSGYSRNNGNAHRGGIRLHTETGTSDGYLQAVRSNSQTYLWRTTSSCSTGMQEWYLKSSDFGTYNIGVDPACTLEDGTTPISRYLCVYGNKILWSSTNAKGFRILPVTERADMQVLEWKANSVVVMYTGTETSATTQVGDNTASLAQTLANQQLTHGVYELTTVQALTANDGAKLEIVFGSDVEKMILDIPVIINSTSTATNGHAAQDVVIVNGGKLTATSDNYSYRNVYVYGDGKLKIASGTSLSVNNIILRAGGITTNGSGGSATYEYVYPQVELGGTLTSSEDNIKYEYITDYDHWYHLCLPFNGTLSTITYPTEYYGDNVTAGNSGSWIIKRYNGAKRATGDYDAWVDIESESATEVTAGHGYIFWGAPKKVSVGGAAKERQQWGIQRMTMAIAAGDAKTAENANKTVSDLAAHSSETGGVNDQGWNLIGNPYMANLTGLESTSLKQGQLVKEMVDNRWTGKWEISDDNTTTRYITVPDNNFETYEAVEVAGSGMTLTAGKVFFVQLADEATAVEFDVSKRASLAPAWHRNAEAEQTVDVETGIVMSSETLADEVNFWIKDGKTEAYEFNADYPKTLNKTNFNIYGVHQSGNLSWVAISPAIAEGDMVIGYQVPAAGDYTLSLSEKYIADDIESVYVTDHGVSPELTTDLMVNTYTFTVHQAETNNERFTVSIKVREKDNTPTDIGNSTVETHAVKFIRDDKMYIMRNGLLYDATGKRVTEINK